MSSSQLSDADRQSYDTSMPEPEIPTRKTPWFMKALWTLAVLLVVGLGYSFWRISAVPTPKLDLPQTPTQSQSTDSAIKR